MRKLGAWATVVLAMGVANVATADEKPVSWNPFASDLADVLRLDAPWTTIRDGAYGSAIMMLHEPGAGPLYDFRRDGLPLGTGHLWSDDPWSISLAGASIGVESTGGSASWASAGTLNFHSFPADTSGAVLDTRFFKGVEESYLRRLSYRTPQAPWILGFDYDEQILHDFKGRDFSYSSESAPPYASVPGDGRFLESAVPDWEAKGRIARTSLWRREPDGGRLRLSYERLRRHTALLPAFDLKRREQWGERLHFGWTVPAGRGVLDLGVALNGSDLLTESVIDSDTRTITSSRQSARANWRRTDGSWSATWEAAVWRVSELGEAEWGFGSLPAYRTARQEAEGRLARTWWGMGPKFELGLGGGWQRRTGVRPRLDGAVGSRDNGWRLGLEYGGRMPRSDELASAWTTATPTRIIRLLPDADLDFERTTRAELSWRGRAVGLDLAASTTARRTRDGIGWLEEGGVATDAGRAEHWGRWANGVDIDSWTAGVRAARAVQLSGLLRLTARIDARGWNLDIGPDRVLPMFLPPERSAALEARWSRVFFHGDGILELGWDVEHRAEATDPWLPGTADRIPALTLHHALVMFRLAGADLGLAFRNVLNHQGALSSGSLAVVQEENGDTSGREMRWRLQWTLRR